MQPQLLTEDLDKLKDQGFDLALDQLTAGTDTSDDRAVRDQLWLMDRPDVPGSAYFAAYYQLYARARELGMRIVPIGPTADPPLPPLRTNPAEEARERDRLANEWADQRNKEYEGAITRALASGRRVLAVVDLDDVSYSLGPSPAPGARSSPPGTAPYSKVNDLMARNGVESVVWFIPPEEGPAAESAIQGGYRRLTDLYEQTAGDFMVDAYGDQRPFDTMIVKKAVYASGSPDGSGREPGGGPGPLRAETLAPPPESGPPAQASAQLPGQRPAGQREAQDPTPALAPTALAPTPTVEQATIPQSGEPDGLSGAGAWDALDNSGGLFAAGDAPT